MGWTVTDLLRLGRATADPLRGRDPGRTVDTGRRATGVAAGEVVRQGRPDSATSGLASAPRPITHLGRIHPHPHRIGRLAGGAGRLRDVQRRGERAALRPRHAHQGAFAGLVVGAARRVSGSSSTGPSTSRGGQLRPSARRGVAFGAAGAAPRSTAIRTAGGNPTSARAASSAAACPPGPSAPAPAPAAAPASAITSTRPAVGVRHHQRGRRHPPAQRLLGDPQVRPGEQGPPVEQQRRAVRRPRGRLRPGRGDHEVGRGRARGPAPARCRRRCGPARRGTRGPSSSAVRREPTTPARSRRDAAAPGSGGGSRRGRTSGSAGSPASAGCAAARRPTRDGGPSRAGARPAAARPARPRAAPGRLSGPAQWRQRAVSRHGAHDSHGR